MNLEDQRNLNAQGDERDEDSDGDRQALSCWRYHAVVTHQDWIDVPPTAGHNATLQNSVDDIEEQCGSVEDKDWRASLVVFGEEDQDEKEDQAGTKLDSWNDAMNDSIHDQSVDVPQWELTLLAMSICDRDELVVDGGLVGELLCRGGVHW
ncbi:hypothetical protein KCU98_g3826, partial [Aureobasidium melanogenum]